MVISTAFQAVPLMFNPGGGGGGCVWRAHGCSKTFVRRLILVLGIVSSFVISTWFTRGSDV